MVQKPATESGFNEARALAHRFAAYLLAEAGRIADRNDAERASAQHVRRAAAHLYQGSGSRRQQAMNTSGDILVGLGGSGVIGFLQSLCPGRERVSGEFVGRSAPCPDSGQRRYYSSSRVWSEDESRCHRDQ
jgi:hypothetical protein